MTLIEISENKLHKMSEYTEDALHAMGRLMSCISALEGGYGERSEGGRYSSRYGGDMGYRHDYDDMPMHGANYGSRMGYRDDEEDEMSERRGRRRDSMGRYR